MEHKSLLGPYVLLSMVLITLTAATILTFISQVIWRLL
jgi:hypothetical protein